MPNLQRPTISHRNVAISAQPLTAGPIGIFDSGFGGLTVLRDIRRRLPLYDYIFLGDNARAPYGDLSFETVYRYTLQGVKHLFSRGCNLVILACNTASAKSLRSIQQHDLPRLAPARRVLGVIRPTTEIVGTLSKSRHVGLLATRGTVNSGSYAIEIQKFFPNVTLTSLPAPMLVPIVENFEYESPGADFFVSHYASQLLSLDPLIDVVILGCTHYPFLLPKLRRFFPPSVRLMPQGEWVARSLADYLLRHPEIEHVCTRNSSCLFLTTDTAEHFDPTASRFLNLPVKSRHVSIDC